MLNIEHIPTIISRAVKANTTVLLLGPPGCSKTTQIGQWCEGAGYWLLNFVATQRNQPDVAGFVIPHKREDGVMVTVYTMSAILATAWAMYNKDGRPGLINIDEIMSADPLMKKAIASFVSERKIDEHELPPGWHIIMTGNRMKDRAGVTTTPMQLLNRISMVEVAPTFVGWRPWAVDYGVHPLYITAMEQNESALISKEVPVEAVPYSTLRSYTYAHDAHMAAFSTAELESSSELPLDDVSSDMIAGFIGAPAAAILFAHLENWVHLPSRAEILADPDHAKLPPKEHLAAQYTAAEMVVSMATRTNIDTVWRYASRMPRELLVATAQKTLQKDRRLLMGGKVFSTWCKNESEFLLEVMN